MRATLFYKILRCTFGVTCPIQCIVIFDLGELRIAEIGGTHALACSNITLLRTTRLLELDSDALCSHNTIPSHERNWFLVDVIGCAIHM